MIKVTKRLKLSLVGGILLGVVCIIGANIRFGSEISSYLVFSLWFNRLLMGLVIGAPWGEVSLQKSLIRGGFLGLMVSFAYYSATGFSDVVSFLAGILYGIIIEYALFKAENPRAKNQS